MAHIHSVYDTDNHFMINAINRTITNTSSIKNLVVQYDHNSERFTFEMPRYVETHDMTLCNVVEVHYENLDSSGKLYSRDVYAVSDLQLCPDDSDVVIFSWLLSGNTSKYAGTLSFSIRFICTTDGNIDYAWNTAIFSGINVSKGINNSEAVAEDNSDILVQLQKETEEAKAIAESAEDIATAARTIALKADDAVTETYSVASEAMSIASEAKAIAEASAVLTVTVTGHVSVEMAGDYDTDGNLTGTLIKPGSTSGDTTVAIVAGLTEFPDITAWITAVAPLDKVKFVRFRKISTNTTDGFVSGSEPFCQQIYNDGTGKQGWNSLKSGSTSFVTYAIADGHPNTGTPITKIGFNAWNFPVGEVSFDLVVDVSYIP